MEGYIETSMCVGGRGVIVPLDCGPGFGTDLLTILFYRVVVGMFLSLSLETRSDGGWKATRACAWSKTRDQFLQKLLAEPFTAFINIYAVLNRNAEVNARIYYMDICTLILLIHLCVKL